jgi:hypothetical protein
MFNNSDCSKRCIKQYAKRCLKKIFSFLFSFHISKLNIGKLTVERGRGKYFKVMVEVLVTLYDFKRMKSRCL